MAQLTEEHINYILKDLAYRGLVEDELQQELLDHICSAVEIEMAAGKRFYDAYQHVLKSFGNTGGIRQLQHQIIYTKIKTTGMLKSYLLIAFRNHLKNKYYTIINVAGLAVAIAACLIILLFVIHEISYDRYHKNADRIYRLNTEIRFGSVNHKLALGSASLAERFQQIYPEIESTVRLLDWGLRFVHKTGSAELFSENVVWGDSTFFKVFTVPLLQGDVETALKEPNTIAISAKMAAKYFPDGDAMDRSLIIEDQNYRVTAVYENIPDNSHFHFDMIRSMAGLEEVKSTGLIGRSELSLYLLLREGASAADLEAKFPAFVEKFVGPQLAAVMQNDFSMEKFVSDGNRWEYSLIPVTDIHLHSDMAGEFETNGSITYVYLFSSIAFFILIIACINFMNLSTARSADRAREVGIRKVMGSLRSHLIRQFLTESFLLSITAFFFAIAIAYLFLPIFNLLAEKNLSMPFDQYKFYITMLAAALFVGLLAGLYPSFFLSGFKPISALKGKLALGSRSSLIRSGLVVFQFVISIFLIVATITIERQFTYIQNKKIGFNKEQILVIHEAHFLGKQIQAFKDEVLRNNVIASGTISGFLPVDGSNRNHNTFWPEGKTPTGEAINDMVTMQTWTIDHDYIKTLGMKLISGRNFSADIRSDSTEAVIVNEAAVERFDLGHEPIGKKISAFGGMNPDGTPDLNNIRTWKVIGVVENFHFLSMRENISPLGLFLERSTAYVTFRFESANTQEVIAAVSKTWKKMASGQPFEYSFLDDDFEKMYHSEKRLAAIFGIFAGLAIVIACLGLFALTSFTARQRTKEIGIRKTLGASIESIVLLLSRAYGKLVLIAFALSAPVAWYAVNWWLESYSYRADIGIVVYLVAGAAAFVVAMLTIGYQCIRAAKANPVNSLRSE